MKYVKKPVKWLLILLGLTIAILYITDTDYLIKAVRTIYMRGYTTAFLDDYKRFDNQIISNGTSQSWPNHVDYNIAQETDALKKTNSEYGTVAY
ncbi:MAG: serine hydrolase, partial [Flavobacteriaceae bacterium]|nr:serine hydrolase [Bacteroidia bacterium]NNL61377.1 serine hydrolase [Flavobacteriaceae bacterium]